MNTAYQLLVGLTALATPRGVIDQMVARYPKSRFWVDVQTVKVNMDNSG